VSNDDAPLVIAERYAIGRPIGQGGMGAVFEAVHVHTGRRLAVKTLLSRYVDDPVLVERFMREARATTAIGDPHVVEIVDIGTTPEGDVFMVMELLEGRELKKAMRQDAPLPVARACYIAHQIAAVMGLAHAKGIVHRDLKPANVFLVPRDRDPDYVKVLDFGIAKLDKATHGETDGHTMTRTGQLIGTPSYMSPEQLQGVREIDGRSDVYALGVILYQMLAGDLPYRGESVPDIFLKVMTTDPPPLGSVRPAVPPALAALVHRALARDVNARFADCAALAAALAPFAAQWVLGSPPTATDIVVSGAAVAGAHASSPSGLSDPVLLMSSPTALVPADGAVPPRPNGVPRWAVPVGLAGVLALGVVLGQWRPWAAVTPTPGPGPAAVVQAVVDRPAAAAVQVPTPLAVAAPVRPDAAVQEAPAPSVPSEPVERPGGPVVARQGGRPRVGGSPGGRVRPQGTVRPAAEAPGLILTNQ